MAPPVGSVARGLSLLPAAVLADGDYVAFCTAAGTGGSFWRGQALTRWRADPTADHQGVFFFVRDRETGVLRTLTRRPWGGPAERESATWRRGTLVLERLADGLESTIEIGVGGGAETRRVTLRNLSGRSRSLDLASYFEVVLQRSEDDAAHPAFSKLFVETAYMGEANALVARRRPRQTGERRPWIAATLAGEGTLEYETDRARLVGRGRFDRPPAALASDRPLAGTVGNVLDPVFCLRRSFELMAGATVTFTLTLAVGESREEALARLREPATSGSPLSAENLTVLEALGVTAANGDGELADVADDVVATPDLPSGATFPSGESLDDFNGVGGFDPDQPRYVMPIGRRPSGALALPPQPWINVLAEPDFGFLVSETGSLQTWSRNSREHRLTPWSNDPVLDPHGEAFYVRDDATGAFWSALPGPSPGPGEYEARHGLGASSFGYDGGGLGHETRLFVPPGESVQVATIAITNRGSQERTLSLYSYRRLVLGTLPELTALHVVSERDPETGALFARNPEAGEFAGGVTFGDLHAAGAAATSFTCDRADFLGQGGLMRAPAALARGALSARAGEGLDPCFAQAVTLHLGPGETANVVALLGEAPTAEAARAIVRRYREPGAAEKARREAVARWDQFVSAVQVRTPSAAIDRMVNDWAPYQTLACRLWGRTAFYQSGGAFGFRDQLQDAAGLALWDPALLRAQIVLHAAHQFVEGDVLHWWHPPGGRGLRTRFADDLVWLPWAAATYVRATGDDSVLAERARFLTARALEPGEDEAYLAPRDSGTAADVYEHCVRALDRAMTRGAHGLPLFGSGDWNDGMNRVGREGKGESVWMGFFLYAVLGDFLPYCEARGDHERLRRYDEYRDDLREALERHGWDGAWYRRAYYDDGAPMGSRESDECQIDALVQAWAVLSGAAPAERARQGMAAAEERLVSERDGIIRLLTPAFDKTPHDPGYIKGYVPGVRENGGQYTHAALWVVRAFAEMGRRDRAARLLEMLSPVSHTRTPEEVERYRVEPYVIAADVYGEPPHVGRGGWTWYTGSAGWLLRVAVESVLGLSLRDGLWLEMRPCVPDDWKEYRITLRLPGEATSYEISVRGAGTVRSAQLDGEALAPDDGAVRAALAHDGRTHRLEIVLG